MCMILDTCQWGEFLQQKPEMLPIHNWLSQYGGKIVTSPHEGIAKEAEPMMKWLTEREQRGQAPLIKWIKSEKIEEACDKLKTELQKKKYRLKSNDFVILALARAGGVKLLCTKDYFLEQDFKQVIKKGRIYKKAKEAQRLLTRETCPKG